jgi:hyperosmotically inducible periplasmic protein
MVMKKLFFSLCLIGGLISAVWAAPPASKASAVPSAEKVAATALPAVDDATLAKQVKEKLAATPSFKDVPFNVTAKGAVVTLEGKVKSGQAKGLATRMAKSVAGVKEVNNLLEIETAAKPAAPAQSQSPKK